MEERLLPSHASAGDIVRTIGLISDTHRPARLPDLPAAVLDIFAGVDFILHAGDVGELWVLDELAAAAPVIAVHGNDDTPDAHQELPYQQVIATNGRRLLLWHSHFPDRADEMAFRQEDAWQPKLRRHIERARRVGASIVVFGHAHIPLVVVQDGVVLVNPGALASGNFFVRQQIQTVALLFLLRDGSAHVTHVNLAAPNQPYTPLADWSNGFRATMAHYEVGIATPELIARYRMARQMLAEPVVGTLLAAIQRAALPCWSGVESHMTPDHVLAELAADAAAPEEHLAALDPILRGGPS